VSTPRDLGWGNPYELSSADMLSVEVYPGRWLRVRNANLGVIFTELIRRLRAAGWPGPSPEKTLDDWGYNGRLKRWAQAAGQQWGSAPMSSVSDHAWGTGVDLDTLANPMLTRQPTDWRGHTNMPPGTRAIAADLLLDWGGTWTAPWDPQHFGFAGTPGQARAIADQIRAGHDQEDELSAADVAAINKHTDAALAEHYRLVARGELDTGKTSPAHAYVSLTALRAQSDLIAGKLDPLSAVRVALEGLGDDEANVRSDLQGVEERLTARIDAGG
jgi:hypothetical protein